MASFGSASSPPTHKRGNSLFVAQLTGEDEDEKSGPVSLQERARWAVKSSGFETAASIMIIAYTAILFVQLQLGFDTALDQGSAKGSDVQKAVFGALAHVFTAVFLLELLLKLFAFRAWFFRSPFNIFDFLVVIITTVDLYVFSVIDESVTNVSFLRTMRILRLARVLRVIRTMDMFQQLRVLMHTIILSFLSIFWSLLILFIFMLVAALLMAQLLQEQILDQGNDPDLRQWMNRYYGTSLKSLYTIFEITFSGCWPTYARRLIEELSPWFSVFFVLYVLFVVFTLIRIIYALLIKDTMQAAANDAEQVVRERGAEKAALVQKLSELFSAADTSGDGYLSRAEFDEILTYPKVQTWMGALGMAVQDHDALFSVLAEGEGPGARISWDEFVQGVLHTRGAAREQDLLRNMRDVRRILKHCQALRSEVSALQVPRGEGRRESSLWTA